MKNLQEKRNRNRLNNLMEKWGYKRDDERPMEAPLAEEEELEEGTKEGDDVKDPLVHGEKAYSAYGEEGASGGDKEVDDAEDLYEGDLIESIREELKKYLTEGGE